MLPDITLIKTKRQKLGIKQKELAYKSGVSQSLIAKIESKRTEPSYSSVNRIFSALESYEHKNDKTCKEVMTKNILSIKKNEVAIKAKQLIKKHGISQLPVLEGKRAVGSISETTLLDNIDRNLSNIQVKDIMDEPFPIVGAKTPVSIALPLLKIVDAILISEKESLVGIITKTDLL